MLENAALVSVLIPCRNEEKYLSACLNSVLAFELPPGLEAEFLVLDGRSEDHTLEIARDFAARDPRLRVLDNPGRIQSTAVNLGVRAARGQWIMRLDAHARYPANYLRLCHATALRTGADNTGGIFVTEPGGSGYQAQIVQALTTHKFGVGNSGFRTGAKEDWADTVPYGFYRREIFDWIGWLDERLVRAQDYEFNRRLIVAGGRILRNPDIRLQYYNQPTLYRFYHKQFVREAPYNAYLWYLAPYSFAYRHAITGVFALGVIGGLGLAPFTPWIGWPYAATLTLYALLALAAALQQATRYRRVWHVLTLPPCFFAYHLLHGIGVLVGLTKLAFGRAPVQQSPEPWPGAGFRRIDARSLKLHASPAVAG